ncbi:gastric triacylglycerol lipase isoform X2 [Folsomia candida]|nr:gastric triacylglycerol lipase isoform X2 [Folsomia candida]
MRSYDRVICHDQFDEMKGGQNPDVGLSIDQLLVRNGYPVEIINVTTEDGYILSIYRIPFSPTSPTQKGVRKKAVMLQHGQGANGLAWLIQGGSRNFAMLLADSGLDVFILNARGSIYSQGHIDPSFSPDNVKYWDFSFHEMGIYDLPAIVEMVTDKTGNRAMYYVGHSMGTSMLTVMLTERPEYNDRILTAFLLSPAIQFGHTAQPLRKFTRFSNYFQYFFNKFLKGKFEAGKMIEQYTSKPPGFLCTSRRDACDFCGNFMYLGFGYNGPQMNYTTLSILLGAFPDTMSTKTWTHFVQLINTDKFCQFNYGFKSTNREKYGMDNPPCYNLVKVSAPIVMFWGQNDIFVKPQDAAKTASKFPKGALKEFIKVEDRLFSHIDFAMAINADILVYNRAVTIMKNATYEFS